MSVPVVLPETHEFSSNHAFSFFKPSNVSAVIVELPELFTFVCAVPMSKVRWAIRFR